MSTGTVLMIFGIIVGIIIFVTIAKILLVKYIYKNFVKPTFGDVLKEFKEDTFFKENKK
jgi:hypothetical protein